MIKRIFTLPKERKVSPQYLKIKLNCLVYSDISLFWEQGEGDAVISLIDKDMVIENRNADINELRLFVNLIRPNSIFSDSETLRKLNLPFESYSVMKLEKEKENKAFISDNLSSKDIYELLKKANFSLPIYEYFATDYCAKHNKGHADYYGKKDMGVAVVLKDENCALINGIASFKKGFGSMLLSKIAADNKDKTVFADCKTELEEFYKKNGFKKVSEVGYWVISNGIF